jgi:hypothetical protein
VKNLSFQRLLSFSRAIGQALQLLTSESPAQMVAPPPTATNCRCTVLPVVPPFLSDLRRMQRFYGIYSTVARENGISPQHVRQVATGLHQSSRVMAALEREYNRIKAEQEREK